MSNLPKMLLTWSVLLLMVSLCLGKSLQLNYIVETRIVVEKSGFDLWKSYTGKTDKSQLKKEINGLFVEVTYMFSSIHQYYLGINFVIQDVTFADENIIKQSTTNPEGEFMDWLKRKPWSKKKPDLTILFTGHNLKNRKNINAMVGEICTDKSVGVVQFNGQYTNVKPLAHEIGHVLGSHHDGDNNKIKSVTGERCEIKAEYVMSPPTHKYDLQKLPLEHYFSYCSYIMIYEHIVGLREKNCLTDGDKDAVVTGPRFGSMFSVDEICQRQTGKSSAYSKRKYYFIYDDDSHCLDTYCDDGAGELSNTQPYPGLYCGKNKQCFNGKCIRTEDGSSTTLDRCPFGDQPKLEDSVYKTCADVPLSHCSKWMYLCCQTCNLTDFSAADIECRRLEGYKSSFARYAYQIYGDEMCSENGLACAIPPITRADGKVQLSKTMHTAPDGLACEKNKRCKDYKCVETSNGNPNMPALCPYGDQPVSWKGDYEALLPCTLWTSFPNGNGKK